jgi:hypothetical protein
VEEAWLGGDNNQEGFQRGRALSQLSEHLSSEAVEADRPGGAETLGILHIWGAARRVAD